MGEDEGITERIIKDTLTITRGCGNGAGEVGRFGVVERGRGKGRKLYLNNNKNVKKNNKLKKRTHGESQRR